MREFLLRDKNINLIASLVIKHVHKISGHIMDKYDENFKNDLNMVITAIVNEEAPKHRGQVSTESVIRINNIIISEATRFILSNITHEETTEQDIQHTSIIDLPDEIQEPPKPEPVMVPPPPVQQEQEPITAPEFVSEYLFINSNDFTKEDEGVYFYNISIDGIDVSLDLLTLDNSDYIITETSCELMVDGTTVSIPLGNYTPEQIVEAFNATPATDLRIKYSPLDECFVMEYPKKSANTVKELKESRSIIVDFCLRNSIHKKLGFDMMTYTIKQGESVKGSKHCLQVPPYIKATLQITEQDTVEYRVPMDVPRNATKFFRDPRYFKLNIQDCNINRIVLRLFNSEGKPYHPRGREFSVNIKLTKLKDI
jgi:hypothetical protein